VRTTIARRILRRRLPVLCRAFRTDVEFGVFLRAALRQRDRHRDHDGGRLLHLLVETAGQADQGAGAETGLMAGRPAPYFFAGDFGATSWPREENSCHSVVQPTCCLWLRLP